MRRIDPGPYGVSEHLKSDRTSILTITSSSVPKSVPDDPARGIDEGELIATNEEIAQNIFDPVIDEILELIDGQIGLLRYKNPEA